MRQRGGNKGVLVEIGWKKLLIDHFETKSFSTSFERKRNENGWKKVFTDIFKGEFDIESIGKN